MKALAPPFLISGIVLFSACGGGGVPPTMEGREGMLSRTAVAQKCDRASQEHLRPFVVEWDATDLSTFEAKARSGTILVRYEGCKLTPLYECSDAARPFGAYGTPEFTSGTVQGFDIANEGELYAELPLGAVKLAGRISAGETLHLKYFVSGIATASRDSLFRGDVDRLTSCRDATHFVWAYNLGAFELESSQKSAGSAEASGFGAGVGAKKESSESQLGHGGKIDNCSTQEQLACRVPIRLELRPIKKGDAPTGPPPIAGPPPAGAGAEAKAEVEKAEAISQLITDAAKKLNEKKDGAACLENLARVVQIDPSYDKNAVVRMIRPRCLMRASKCDEGMRDMRDYLAADDSGRRKTDAQLDEEVRQNANRECSAAEAKNPTDKTLRILRELYAAWPKEPKTCQSRFDELAKELTKIPTGGDRFEREALSQGGRQLPRLVSCVATAGDCKTAYTLYERYYVWDHPKGKDPKAQAKKEWVTFQKREKLSCP